MAQDHVQVESPSSAGQPREEDSPLTEMLSRDPSRIMRRFLYVLFFFLTVALGVSALVRIDVTVTAPAVVQPRGRTLLIQPDMDGTVLTVQVKEGDLVARGDILAELASEKAGEQLLAVRDAEMKLTNARHEHDREFPKEKEKILAQIKGLEGKRAARAAINQILDQKKEDEKLRGKRLPVIYAAEVDRLGEKENQLVIDAHKAERVYTERVEELKVLTDLRKRQVVTDLELTKARLDFEEAFAFREKNLSQRRQVKIERDLLEKQHLNDLQENQRFLGDIEEQIKRNELENQADASEMTKLKHELQMRKLQVEKTLRTAEFDLKQARLKAELTRGDDNRHLVQSLIRDGAVVSKLLVTAPCDGRVGTVVVRHAGEKVTRGQALMHLLPDGPLIAEIRIANKDIGLIKAGQTVKLKLDAFPYAEYGAVTGELLSIPPDAEKGEHTGESFYRALANLDDQGVVKNGAEIPLLSGMTATAEIVTERKTILEIILTPFLPGS